jgi:hypothetical protein
VWRNGVSNNKWTPGIRNRKMESIKESHIKLAQMEKGCMYSIKREIPPTWGFGISTDVIWGGNKKRLSKRKKMGKEKEAREQIKGCIA